MSLKDHLDYPNEVAQIIHEERFNELFHFTNFSLCRLRQNNTLFKIVKTSNNKIIKYIIKNATCINFASEGYCLIHYLYNSLLKQTIAFRRLLFDSLFDFISKKYKFD